jgi:hypothetical protein
MNTIKFRNIFILGLFVCLSFLSKAQYDTMYINNAYRSQYMFPELKSPACQQVIENFEFWNGGTLNMICQSHGVGSYENCVKKIGHKFDITTDTVKLIGTGILMTSRMCIFPNIPDYDSITVSIWNSNLTTELYSKRVFRATYHPDLPLSERRQEQAILEVLFNDTITLTESFHIIVSTPCYDGNEQTKTWIHGILARPNGLNPEIGVIDYGYNPKYYPALMWCDGREPIQLDFPDTCYYVQEFLSTCVGCDELMYPECAHETHYDYPIIFSPAGMFPIKAVENGAVEDSVNSAISRVELENRVTISPNPAKDVLNISCDDNIIGIEIRDEVGRLLEERKVNERNLQLNVSNYSAGTYVVVVITEKGRIGKKIIVQK